MLMIGMLVFVLFILVVGAVAYFAPPDDQYKPYDQESED